MLDRLESQFGKQTYSRRFEPMDELVSCILSQNTTDATSFPTFYALKEKYPSWQQVVDLGPKRLAVAIKRAGLAQQKANSIINSLREIKRRNGAYNIDNLKKMPMREARDWLTSLPGVGMKTASIVLCFSFNMEAIPVDTHILRVSQRLGFVPPKATADKAHEVLLEKVPRADAYRYHTLLIQHGRTTCKAQRPKCAQCVLNDLCPSRVQEPA